MNDNRKVSLDARAFASELGLSPEQTIALTRYVLPLQLELRALRHRVEDIPRLEHEIADLKNDLINQNKQDWQDTPLYSEMKAQIDKLKQDLDAVLNFTKLLDMKDMPPSSIGARQLSMHKVKDANIKVPFAGKYTGTLIKGVPHGSGQIVSTESTIAQKAPKTERFHENWLCEFYLGRPIGRICGVDTAGNNVQFLQLQGRHQGYEIASFSDGGKAYVCVDMTKAGVCVQIIPSGKSEPTRPYGDLHTGLRITIQKPDQQGSFFKNTFGTVVIDEVEGGISKKNWRYILDSAHHMMPELPKHKYDAKMFLEQNQLRAGAMEEILHQSGLRKSMQ